MASSTPPVTLPSNLYDVYQQYKTSTAMVLKWLGDNETITSQSRVTVNQWQSAAENVYANNIQVPEAIYRAFRDSVAKRRKVTNWFMSAELSAGGEISQFTSNHIHFTEKWVISRDHRAWTWLTEQIAWKKRSWLCFQTEIESRPIGQLARVGMKMSQMSHAIALIG